MIGLTEVDFLGKYAVNKDTTITALLRMAHTDPKVWGSDSRDYKPERMLPEAFAKLPRNAFKAFGNGSRACIGRAFAVQVSDVACHRGPSQVDDLGGECVVSA